MSNDKSEELTAPDQTWTSDGWEEVVERPYRIAKEKLLKKFEKDLADWMLTPWSDTKH